jgi:hypothetical protein
MADGRSSRCKRQGEVSGHSGTEITEQEDQPPVPARSSGQARCLFMPMKVA